MKRKNAAAAILLAASLAATSVASVQTADAKRISSPSQAEKMALAKVSGATVIEVDSDSDDGMHIYEVELVKGSKKYTVGFRASDGKEIEYGWEENRHVGSTKGSVMSRSKCKKLALKKVKGAHVINITTDYEDDYNIRIYEVHLKKGSKKYDLEYNAVSGTLIKYKWEMYSSDWDFFDD